MAQPHEVGGGRMVRLPSCRSGIRARHCRACLTYTALTPAAGRSVRSKATLRGDIVPGGMSRLIGNKPGYEFLPSLRLATVTSEKRL